MNKKVILLRDWTIASLIIVNITLCGKAVADDTKTLAVILADTSTPAVNVIDSMNRYGFNVESFAGPNSMGFYLINGKATIGSPTLCRNLRKNGIVIVAHEVVSSNDAMRRLAVKSNDMVAVTSLLVRCEDAFPALLKAMQSETEGRVNDPRWLILGVLAKATDSNVLSEIMENNYEDPFIRMGCINALSLLHEQSGVACLLAQFKNERQIQWYQILAYALANSGSTNIIPTMREVIDSDCQQTLIRDAAAYALAVAKDSYCLPYLRMRVANVLSGHDENCEMVLQALGEVGKYGDSETLRSLQNDSDYTVARKAIITGYKIHLSTLQPHEMIDWLKAFVDGGVTLQSDNMELGQWSIAALANMHSMEADSALRQLVTNNSYWESAEPALSMEQILKRKRDEKMLFYLLLACVKDRMTF